MSKLDEQLQELKAKKRKTEFYKGAIKCITDALNGNKDFNKKEDKDCLTEVLTDINTFINQRIDSIENDTNTLNPQVKFTKEQTEFLLTLAKRGMSKTSSKQLNPTVAKEDIYTSKKKAQIETQVAMDKQDKIKFSLRYRPLANERVTTNQGHVGIVVGLDAPYAIVKLDNGAEVKVDPDTLGRM